MTFGTHRHKKRWHLGHTDIKSDDIWDTQTKKMMTLGTHRHKKWWHLGHTDKKSDDIWDTQTKKVMTFYVWTEGHKGKKIFFTNKSFFLFILSFNFLL